MTDFRYDAKAQVFEDELHEELDGIRKELETKAAEVAEAGTKESGMDFVVSGKSPREAVEEIIRGKKKSAPGKIKEHEVGKKMAAMALEGRLAVDEFLGTKD